MEITGRLRSLDARAEARLRKWQLASAPAPLNQAAVDARTAKSEGRAFRSALLSVLGIAWILNHALSVTVPLPAVVVAIVAFYVLALRRTKA